MALQAPSAVDIQEFQYKLHCRLKIFENESNGPFKNQCSLLATASRYGLIFVGSLTSSFQVIQISTIENADKDSHLTNYNCRQISLPSSPKYLDVNCDNSKLAVIVERDNCAVALIYDVTSMLKSNIPEPTSVRLSSTTNVNVIQSSWNPTVPEILTVCKSDGTLGLYELKLTGLVINELPPEAQVTCMCWSPKGKQLAVGSINGSITQYKPDLKAVKVINGPALETPHSIVALQWVSNYQFIGIFTTRQGENSSSLIVIDAPKTGNPIYINYDDICYSYGNLRPVQFYMILQPNWNVLMVASSNSTEVGVLASEKEKWIQWTLVDSARAELPLSSSKQETFPVGIAFDTAAQEPMIWGESSLPPVPFLLLLSHHGLLCCFRTLNMNTINQPICKPPEPIADKSGLDQFISSQLILSKQQISTARTETTQTGSTSLNAIPAQTPQLNFSLNPTTTSVLLFQQQAQTFISKPATVFPSTVSSVPSVPLFQTQVQTVVSKPQTVFTTTVEPVLTSSLNQSQIQPLISKPQIGFTANIDSLSKPSAGVPNLGSTIVSTQPQQTLQAPIKSQPLSIPKVTSTVINQQSQSTTNTVIKPSELPFQSSSKTVLNNKYILPPETISISPKSDFVPVESSENLTASVENPGGQEEESKIIYKLIREECETLESELRLLLKKVASIQFQVGTDSEAVQLVQGADELVEFMKEMKDILVGQSGEVHSLKQGLLQAWSWYEDARSRFAKSKDSSLETLLHVQKLDPVSQRYLNEMKCMTFYLESQLVQASRVLDEQWENFQDACKKVIRFKIPTLEAIYQTMVRQSAIYQKQKYILKDISNRIRSNKSKITGPSLLISLNNTDHLEEELKRLQLEPQSWLQVQYNKAQQNKKKLTSSKIKDLDNLLSNREITRIIANKSHLSNNSIQNKLQESIALATKNNRQNDASILGAGFSPISSKKNTEKICDINQSTPKVNTINNFNIGNILPNLQPKQISLSDQQTPHLISLKNSSTVATNKEFEKAKLVGDKTNLSKLPEFHFNTPKPVTSEFSSNPSQAFTFSNKEISNVTSAFAVASTTTTPQFSFNMSTKSSADNIASTKPLNLFGNTNTSTSFAFAPSTSSSSSVSTPPKDSTTFVFGKTATTLSSVSLAISTTTATLAFGVASTTQATKTMPNLVSTSSQNVNSSGIKQTEITNVSSSSPLNETIALKVEEKLSESSQPKNTLSFPVSTSASSLNFGSSFNTFKFSSDLKTVVTASSIFGTDNKSQNTSITTPSCFATSKTATSSTFTNTPNSSSESQTLTGSLFSNPSSDTAFKFTLDGKSSVSMFPVSSSSLTTTASTTSKTTTFTSSGTSSIFSSSSTPSSTSIFAATKPSVSASISSTTSIFSSTNTSSTAFTFANNIFGNTPKTTSTSLFGSNNIEISSSSTSSTSITPAINATVSKNTSIFGAPAVTSVQSTSNSPTVILTTPASICIQNISTTTSTVTSSQVSLENATITTSSKSYFGTPDATTQIKTVPSSSLLGTPVLSDVNTSENKIVTSPPTGLFNTPSSNTSASFHFGSNSSNLVSTTSSTSATPFFSIFGNSNVQSSMPSSSTTNSVFTTNTNSAMSTNNQVLSPTTTTTVAFNSSTSNNLFKTTTSPLFSNSPSTGSPLFGISPQISVFPVSKTESNNTTAFTPSTTGAAVGFGTPPNTVTSPFTPSTTANISGFGNSSVFGNSQHSSSEIFGTSAFATTTAGSLFAAFQNKSLFGTPTSSTTTGSFGGNSIFGSNTSTMGQSNVTAAPAVTTSISNTSSIFGSPNQQHSKFGFGAVASTTDSNILPFGNLSFQSSPFQTSTTSSFGSAFGPNSATNVNPFAKSTAPKTTFEGGNLFSKPASGATTTGSMFGGNSNSSFAFGASGNSSSIFGQSTNFGTQSTFGQPSNFGQNTFGNNNSFGSGSFTSGNQSIAQSGFGGFGQAPKSPGFGGAPVFGSSPGFGAPPAFGSGATFGGSATFGSPQKGFGDSSTFTSGNQQENSTFANLANQNTLGFGSLAQQSPTNQNMNSFSGGSSFSTWR